MNDKGREGLRGKLRKPRNKGKVGYGYGYIERERELLNERLKGFQKEVKKNLKKPTI